MAAQEMTPSSSITPLTTSLIRRARPRLCVPGADTLSAGNGNDTLVSGTGTAVQSLVGGTGNDLFVVNYASDVVTVGATHGVDTIESSVSYSAAANVANLTLIGTSSISGTGSSLTGVLTANSSNDTLTAVGSATTLIGGAGNDVFVI